MLDTDRTKPRRRKGFSLVEVATVLVVLAVITVILVPIAGSLVSGNRSNEAIAEAFRIYTAVVGDPSKNFYGYVGDTGQFPSSLMDLIQSPGVSGWNGPYLNGVHLESGYVADPYGSPYECYYSTDTSTATADHFAIISRGPDLQSTNMATSNQCTKYNGSTMPASYAQSGDDEDNVVYPRFTDNSSLLKYNQVGTLSITIFNFDQNSLVNALVPGCPHFYTISVSPVSRTTNESFTMPYNPGANSVDLVQGLYKVTITSPLSSGVLWQDQVVINPGATISKTATLNNALNSSSTTAQSFAPSNNYGSTLTFLSFNSGIGAVANLTSSGISTSPRACAQIMAQTPSSQVVDAFVYPYLGSTYNRKVNTNNLCTLTILNSNVGGTASRNQVLVYDSGVFIGIVSSRGAYKSKDIFNIKQGNLITVKDTDGVLLNTAPGTTMGCPSTITV